jgi:hypothetical protein
MRNFKKRMWLSAMVGCCSGIAFAGNASVNVALNKAATASASTSAELPNRAFDGDLTTNWCTPGYEGWIQVDLQNHFSIDSLKLYVNQYVPGNTVHEVNVSNDMVHWTPVDTLSGYTSNNQRLTIAFKTALSAIRGVRLRTITSNSWVAWYEIEAYGTLSKPTISREVNVLTSSSTVNNQWYLNGNPIPNATAPTYTMTVPGSYQVRVSEGNSSEVLSEVFTVTEITTGIAAIRANDVQVYPNPANDRITIEGVALQKIELLNMKGQVLRRLNSAETKTRMDVSTLAKGVYSLKMTTADGTIVQKIVKQ